MTTLFAQMSGAVATASGSASGPGAADMQLGTRAPVRGRRDFPNLRQRHLAVSPFDAAA